MELFKYKGLVQLVERPEEAKRTRIAVQVCVSANRTYFAIAEKARQRHIADSLKKSV